MSIVGTKSVFVICKPYLFKYLQMCFITLNRKS